MIERMRWHIQNIFGRSKRIEQLPEFQLDALREVATIGMGHATKSLSEMINRKIDIEMSKIELIPVGQIASRLKQKNTLVTGIYLRLRGDLRGTSLLFFSRGSALLLADILNNRKLGTTTVLRKIDRSALGELGSILTASYFNALTELLDLKVEISVPSVVFDIASAIIYFVLLSTREVVTYSLVSQTEFVSSGGSISGEFIFLLNDESIHNMLDAIYKKLESTGARSYEHP